ncbi:roadblock/LC7 domain-containing protein [Actinacidiphila yeochonensis]|uniref:roadblock/LC7 domain-containing protein n=1 Tax=Actinacidiphila yeochonensis TaxID=89050 RepID=UPI0007C75457|nr:roadblock/LC7 domain-containing protein [Actinacidiphila yeochonensis]
MTSGGLALEGLLGEFVADTPGARHALVLSGEGLTLGRSPGLPVDLADHLAAIASGIQSLTRGASAQFGDGSGGVRQSMTEFHGGTLFIVEAGTAAHLAVIGEEFADAGAIGRGMGLVAESVRAALADDGRVAYRAPGTAGTTIGTGSGAGTGTGTRSRTGSPARGYGKPRA